jgi:hypothetical protein
VLQRFVQGFAAFCHACRASGTLIFIAPSMTTLHAELAYWQVAYPGSLRSSVITLDYFAGQCLAAFGVPSLTSTDAINNRYGGAKPNASQVYASNGSDDPWQPATVRVPLSPAYPATTAVCDGCSHCRDLRLPSTSDSPGTTAQRADIRAYLMRWLRVGGSGGGSSPKSNGLESMPGLLWTGVPIVAVGLGIIAYAGYMAWRSRSFYDPLAGEHARQGSHLEVVTRARCMRADGGPASSPHADHEKLAPSAERFDEQGILTSSGRKSPFPGKLWAGIGVLVTILGIVLILAYALMAQAAQT